jgi:hypothetical protein
MPRVANGIACEDRRRAFVDEALDHAENVKQDVRYVGAQTCARQQCKDSPNPLAATTITAPIRGQFGWLSESLKIPESRESIFKKPHGQKVALSEFSACAKSSHHTWL